MWSKLWHTIGSGFEYFFELLPFIGNQFNYLYIFIIIVFLSLWTFKMTQNKEGRNS